MEQLERYFSYVDEHAAEYVARLAEAVAIPSVSADPKHRPDCLRMIDFMRGWFTRLGIESELRPLGPQNHHEGLELPPVLLGHLGSDPAKRTVGIYGHLDVQPAKQSDGWKTDPWKLEEDSQGRLFGRGSTDDKGPSLGWLFMIEAHQKLGIELPVNLVFCFESMEESGSEGLGPLIEREAQGYFKKVDCWCISDNYWLGTRKPCVQYGLRGICYLQVEVSGPARDLHSGRGGTVHEPMAELIRMLDSLVDPASGKITIPGVLELVPPLSASERQSFEEVDFEVEDFRSSNGVEQLRQTGKVDVLEAMWRQPSLTLHGIEGAFSDPGAKTVIPARVIGKFSIRLVDGMDPDKVEALVRQHLETIFTAFSTPNRLKIIGGHSAAAFAQDVNDFNYLAARRATEQVYGEKPNLVRSGGSIPNALTFQQTGKSVLLLPMGRGDDGQHGPNEKLDKSNYLKGMKLFGVYLHEVAKAEKESTVRPAKRAKVSFCKIHSATDCRCCI